MKSHKIKAMKKGKNDKNDNFEMDNTDEGVLDIALAFIGKLINEKIWKTICEVIEDEYFK